MIDCACKATIDNERGKKVLMDVCGLHAEYARNYAAGAEAENKRLLLVIEELSKNNADLERKLKAVNALIDSFQLPGLKT